MSLRVCLVLLSGWVVSSAGAQEVYQRGENFNDEPANWEVRPLQQFYGYQRTTVTGGTAAAGGFLLPKQSLNYYADVFLNGALQRNDAVSASGRLALRRTSGEPPYRDTAYIGHFGRNDEPYLNSLGIALVGESATTLLASPVIQFADGNAYIGGSIRLTVSTADYVTWSYSWIPGGGTQGVGTLIVKIGDRSATLNLPKASEGSDFFLNSFGLYQPAFIAPNSNTFVELYIGKLAYTAFAGNTPTVRVKAPKRVTTSLATVTLRGTASVGKGNRIVTVRARVIRGGKAGSYRAAKGKTNWTVEVRVPPGASRVQIQVRTDSGRTRTVERRVTRS